MPQNIFVLSKTFTCFEMGPPLRREEECDYCWSLPLYWGVTLLAFTLTYPPVSVFKLNEINIAGEEVVTTYYKKFFLHPLSGTDVNN
jgi:hypothetical protein